MLNEAILDALRIRNKARHKFKASGRAVLPLLGVLLRLCSLGPSPRHSFL